MCADIYPEIGGRPIATSLIVSLHVYLGTDVLPWPLNSHKDDGPAYTSQAFAGLELLDLLDSCQ